MIGEPGEAELEVKVHWQTLPVALAVAGTRSLRLADSGRPLPVT